MKKLITILLCLPLTYSLFLFSGCSSGGASDNPSTTEGELVGSWERSAVGYNYTIYSYFPFYDDYVPVDGGNLYLTETAMTEFFGYDRYVIELHSDNTYDYYKYSGSVATTGEGTWSATTNTISFDGNEYSYTKYEDTYEIFSPHLDDGFVWLDSYTYGVRDYMEFYDVYEHFKKID